ncbi:IS1/IS1595 family N-terminal zinc-binding domain-containing protein [Alicyclobacillus hesperidum]|uniref:IS1/IS1595 family N-terminal zinc-binding domain-containing protein n=1 Tax=Alicyclobacillus hesperidum TaxID=89784 RepID=UPI0036F282C5
MVCPRCQNKSTIRHGKVDDRQRYLCKSCRGTFSDLTGTPLAYVKKSTDMWVEVARCMRDRAVKLHMNSVSPCLLRSIGDTRYWFHFTPART